MQDFIAEQSSTIGGNMASRASKRTVIEGVPIATLQKEDEWENDAVLFEILF